MSWRRLLGRIFSLGRMIYVFPCVISHLVCSFLFPWGAQCVCGGVGWSLPFHTLQLPPPSALLGCLGGVPGQGRGCAVLRAFGVLVLGAPEHSEHWRGCRTGLSLVVPVALLLLFMSLILPKCSEARAEC